MSDKEETTEIAELLREIELLAPAFSRDMGALNVFRGAQKDGARQSLKKLVAAAIEAAVGRERAELAKVRLALKKADECIVAFERATGGLPAAERLQADLAALQALHPGELHQHICPNCDEEFNCYCDLMLVSADLATQHELAEEGHRLLGSFFGALKPLNLQAIDVQDPGSHVANLITERNMAEAEAARLRADLAAAQTKIAAARQEGLDEGASCQAILEVQGRDRFLEHYRTELKEKVAAAEQRGREAEREDCAVLAGSIYPDLDWPLAANFAIRDRIACAIRTRGEKTESTLPGGASSPEDCAHEWKRKTDSQFSNERFTEVQCVKCGCVGEENEETGSVYWPAT